MGKASGPHVILQSVLSRVHPKLKLKWNSSRQVPISLAHWCMPNFLHSHGTGDAC